MRKKQSTHKINQTVKTLQYIYSYTIYCISKCTDSGTDTHSFGNRRVSQFGTCQIARKSLCQQVAKNTIRLSNSLHSIHTQYSTGVDMPETSCAGLTVYIWKCQHRVRDVSQVKSNSKNYKTFDVDQHCADLQYAVTARNNHCKVLGTHVTGSIGIIIVCY